MFGHTQSLNYYSQPPGTCYDPQQTTEQQACLIYQEQTE